MLGTVSQILGSGGQCPSGVGGRLGYRVGGLVLSRVGAAAGLVLLAYLNAMPAGRCHVRKNASLDLQSLALRTEACPACASYYSIIRTLQTAILTGQVGCGVATVAAVSNNSEVMATVDRVGFAESSEPLGVCEHSHTAGTSGSKTGVLSMPILLITY